MGLNFEHRLDLITGAEVINPSGGPFSWLGTQIGLDPSDYDGATFYAEIVFINTDPTNDYTWTLERADHTVMATITLPHNTTDWTVARSSAWTPTSGLNFYQQLTPSATNNDVQVNRISIPIVQVNATKTRIQIPLGANASGVATNDSQNSCVANNPPLTASPGTEELLCRRWLREDSLFGSSVLAKAEFEIVANTNAKNHNHYVLYNLTDGTVVSDILTSSDTGKVIQTDDFTASANFIDGKEYAVYSYATGGINPASFVSRVCIYLTITSIDKLGLYFSVSTTSENDMIPVDAPSATYSRRISLDPANFSSAAAQFEMVGLSLSVGNIVIFLSHTANPSLGGTAVDPTNAEFNFTSSTRTRVRGAASFNLPSAGSYFTDMSRTDSSTVQDHGAWMIVGVTPFTAHPSFHAHIF